MKSGHIASGAIGNPGQFNGLRDDAQGSGTLLAHQQLGAYSLGTNPGNNQTITITINGTAITLTAKSVAVANPGEFLIGSSISATLATVMNLLQNPWTTNGTQVALTLANQELISYVGFAISGTTITAYSLNTTINGQLSSFAGATTFTSGSYTANTMRLYVEPGVFYVGLTQVKFLGGSTPTVTAPGANPRIDVLTIDTSGTLAWTTGSENASPTVPAYPSGKVPICELFNVVAETALYDNANQQTSQGYIQADVRPFNNIIYINNASQIASGIVLMDPGSDAQGDVYYWNGSQLARLPAGTNNQVLVTKGAGANPQWGNPPALNILDDENITAGGSAFTTATFSAKTYLRVVVMVQAPTSNRQMRFQFNSDSGTNYEYEFSVDGGAATKTTSATYIKAGSDSATDGKPQIYVLDILNFSAANKVIVGHMYSGGASVTGQQGLWLFGGTWVNTSAQITTITIDFTSINFTSGDRIIVYGS